jgi:hypothetical protein
LLLKLGEAVRKGWECGTASCHPFVACTDQRAKRRKIPSRFENFFGKNFERQEMAENSMGKAKEPREAGTRLFDEA